MPDITVSAPIALPHAAIHQICMLLRRRGKRKLLPQKRAGKKALLGDEAGMAGRGMLVLEDLPMNVLATPVAWRTRRTGGAKVMR